jgi:hypothetical protein
VPKRGLTYKRFVFVRALKGVAGVVVFCIIKSGIRQMEPMHKTCDFFRFIPAIYQEMIMVGHEAINKDFNFELFFEICNFKHKKPVV